MGLIKAAASAISSTFHDQWKDFINCEDLGNDTLMVKKTTENGVISKNSAIEVKPGQVAVIFDSGRILDATAEEGIYTFDESSSPSFFTGQFGAVFKEMWARFVYNGAVSKEQAVFFINSKEIIDNKFGTPAPVPYQDWSHPIPNQMTNTLTPLRVQVKCFGKYTFKIADPAVFMREIAGTSDVYKKDMICEQMRSEVQSSFQNVLNELGNSEHKAPVLELPSQTDEIKKVMDEKVFDQKIRDRGMAITGFIIESVTLDDESNKKIDDYELSSNAYMQQGRLVSGYADAVKLAANNANGAATGMIGVGMVNMASGGMMGNTTNNAFANTENSRMDLSSTASTSNESAQTEEKEEVKEETGTSSPKPKYCTNCGTLSNGGNFCANCGTKLN